MQAPGSVSAVIFTFDKEVTIGDCHMRPKALIRISAAQDGYDLRLSAQIYTDKSLFGDVWHITWEIEDASGHASLTSPKIDYPPNARMHPQFGDYNIDYTIHFGPDTPSHIAQTLSNAKTLKMIHSC